MSTIYDVARHAGVSPKTVSRVLNNDAPVKEETRLAVEQAIQELGYIPSSAARALRSQRSGLIGVITGVCAPDTYDDEYVRGGLPDMFLVQGIQQVVSKLKKTVMVTDCAGQVDALPSLMHQFQQYRAEGIICVSESHQQIELPFLPKCPIVLLNCFDETNTPAVLPDDRTNQYQLTSQLIANGHQRIAYITLPEYIAATPLRLDGYRHAMWNAGLPVDNNLIATGYLDRRNNINDLWQALERVLSQPEKPTVLCFGNDEMAMRAYGMLRAKGIRIPEDMSVAGFDDHKQIAETLYPTLTTVELPYIQMGQIAAQIVLQPDKKNNPIVCVAGKVAWRESVLKIEKTD